MTHCLRWFRVVLLAATYSHPFASGVAASSSADGGIPDATQAGAQSDSDNNALYALGYLLGQRNMASLHLTPKEVRLVEQGLADGAMKKDAVIDVNRQMDAVRTFSQKQSAAVQKPKAQTRTIKSPALENLCDLNAEQQRELADLRDKQANRCGGSSMSPSAIPCNRSFEQKKMATVDRYAARMPRFREKAEKDLGRPITETDCCAALPSRYQLFGDRCVVTQ